MAEAGEQRPKVAQPGALIRGLSPLSGVDGERPAALIGDGMLIDSADSFMLTLPIHRLTAGAVDRVPELVARIGDKSISPFESAFAGFEAARIQMWEDNDAALDILAEITRNEDHRFSTELQLQAYLRAAVVEAFVPGQDADEDRADQPSEDPKRWLEPDPVDYCTEVVLQAVKELDLTRVDRYRAILFSGWMWCVGAQQGRTRSDWLDKNKALRASEAGPDATAYLPNVLAVRAWLRSLTDIPDVPVSIAAKARILLAESLMWERYADQFWQYGTTMREAADNLLRVNEQVLASLPGDTAAVSLTLRVVGKTLGPNAGEGAMDLIHEALTAHIDLFSPVTLADFLDLSIGVASRMAPGEVEELRKQREEIVPEPMPPLPPFPPPSDGHAG